MQLADKKRNFGETLATIAFFAFCALALFGFKVAQGYVLAPEDDFVQNYPAFASAGTLWTPLLLSGFPVLADPQVQFFYPLAWLAKHLPLGSDMTANFNLYIASAYVLAGYFAALLARKLTGSFYAGLLGGLVYGFSGYLISELKHVQVLHTALWLPLILYLMELARDHLSDEKDPESLNPKREAQRQLRPLRYLSILFALSLVVACTVFAGHPQTALYVLVTASAYLLLLSHGKKWPLLLGTGALAIGSGVLICAIQLLPSMELSSFSARTTFTYRDFIVGQVEPLQVVGFFIPYIMGGAYGTIGDLPFSEQGPPPGLMFFGFAPLVLTVFALIQDGHQRRVRFFAVLAVFAFLLSLGAHAPFAGLVYFLPFFGSFRGLYRVLVLVALAIAVLSAYGLARLEKEYWGKEPLKPGLDLGQMGIAKHAVICLFVVISCFSYNFLLGTLPLLLFFIRLDSSRFKFLSFLYRDESTIRQKILLLTTATSLALYGLNAEWAKSSPLAGEFKPPALATVYGAETVKSLSRILTLKGLQGARDQLPPNLSRLWNVPSATGYEPLVSRRYSRLLGIAEGGFIEPPWHFSAANRAFDITCVKYLFAPWSEFSPRAFDLQSKEYWKLTQATAGTLIYENKRVLPRFYLVPEARSLASEAIYQSIVCGKLPDGASFDPTRTVLLEVPSQQGLNSSSSSSSAEPRSLDANQRTKENKTGDSNTDDKKIVDYSLADEELTFKVQLAKNGYFILADLFYPGWEVTVDGQAEEILAANYVQRAVVLKAGEHNIIFKFQPKSLSQGRIITLVVFALWLFAMLGTFFLTMKSKMGG